MPCTKAMNWEGKTYSSLVIRGFIRGTPVVEKCSIRDASRALSLCRNWHQDNLKMILIMALESALMHWSINS